MSEQELVKRCLQVIEEHLDDEQFNVKLLATRIGVSHSGLYKRIKASSGLSVNAFIRLVRLQRAADILLYTDSNVNQTANQVGISSIKYFRIQFVRQFGVPPSVYRKDVRQVSDRC
ncbi:helix-turn-helix domain-containing protein [Flavihumibacter sp. UBA7668]|uniref:helix-turn-helix domain-containing protein n=1 Tax=Flavihumibacter sp. UBA7668 TaxID=1946542 RepID=UPI0025C405CF|nr:AraC family transcriptional regulator [Flavihumibacter sp. UBA7668]